jgi:hypothetical protein
MSGTGTPLSLGAMLLPIMMFVGAGYSAAKAYDDKKAKSKMMYFWALMFIIFVGGGYYTLTQGLTLKNLGNRAKAAAAQVRPPTYFQPATMVRVNAPGVPVAQGMPQPQMVPI